MCSETGNSIGRNVREQTMIVNRVQLYVCLLCALVIVLMPAHSVGDVDIPDPELGVSVGKTISMDAKDADIRDILLGLARDNGINLVMDESVQGQITISLSDLTPTEAIGSILHTNGFSIERVGDLIIAGTAEQLRNILPPVSKIIALRHATAAGLKESLGEIAPAQVSIQVDTRTNSLIVSGTTSGVNALEQAAELLDVEIAPTPQAPIVTRTLPLEYAQASMIKALVSELCSPDGKVLVDERTNSLVITDKLVAIQRLEEAINQLDVPTSFVGKEGEAPVKLYTRVFTLNYIDANALKDVVQEMLSPAGKVQALVRQKKSLTPVQPEKMGVTAREQRNAPRSNAGVIDEKWSDILIITDTGDSIERMDELVSKLDTRTPQVMIEARMVELTLSDVASIGIDWNAKHAPSKSTLGVGMPSNRTEGLNLQIGTISTRYFEDVMLRVQALETSGQAKLVSNPSVITLDNELAQMVVADRIPVPTTHETEFSATTSYEFINVGIMLTVVPHITEDGYILMDAMPEVNSIKEWTTGESPQPIISSRMAHTRVRIKDGQTFVIGGLIRDEQRETVSRVPILHAVPLLGRLFRTKGTDSVKTDLVVFITPRICNDDS